MIVNFLNIDRVSYGSSGVETADRIYEQLKSNGLRAYCFNGRTITIPDSSHIEIERVKSILFGEYRSWQPCVESDRSEKNEIQISLKAVVSRNLERHMLKLRSPKDPFAQQAVIHKSNKTGKKTGKTKLQKEIKEVVKEVVKDEQMKSLQKQLKQCSIEKPMEHED